MCGRYTLRRSFEEILACLEALLGDELGTLDQDHSRGDVAMAAGRFNIRPSHDVLVLRHDGTSPCLALSRWGYQPAWMTPDYQRQAKRGPFINARAETVHTARAFAPAAASQRCLIIADGFYEATTEAGGKRTPHFFEATSSDVFLMAGIEASFPSAEWRASHSNVAILTQEAQGVARDVHHRMPVILSAKQAIGWLRASQLPEATATVSALTHRPVSTWVNQRDAEGPQCLASPEPEPVSAQGSLF
ncbi:MAG: SOS response-associated peptidase [Pseudomonadota bacterium]